MPRIHVPLDPSVELKTERVRIALTPDLLASIKAHAKTENWSVHETIEYLLRYALKDHVTHFANGVPNLIADTLTTLAQQRTRKR